MDSYLLAIVAPSLTVVQHCLQAGLCLDSCSSWLGCSSILNGCVSVFTVFQPCSAVPQLDSGIVKAALMFVHSMRTTGRRLWTFIWACGRVMHVWWHPYATVMHNHYAVHRVHTMQCHSGTAACCAAWDLYFFHSTLI